MTARSTHASINDLAQRIEALDRKLGEELARLKGEGAPKLGNLQHANTDDPIRPDNSQRHPASSASGEQI